MRGRVAGVELGQEGAVTLGGPEQGPVGDRFVESPRSGVDFGGGGGWSQGGDALAVFYEEGEGGEAGLDGQNGDWSGGNAIRDPSLDVSPEGVESILHFHEGSEEIGAVSEDRSYKGGSKPVAEVRRKAFTREGEAFDAVEGTLGQEQTAGEVGVGGQGRGKPVPQPPNFIFGGKVQVVKPDP